MRFKSAFSLAAIFLILSALPGRAPFAQKVVNIEAKGNLKPTVALGCMDLDKVVNTETPADLYPAMSACIHESDYEKAVRLFAVAGVYARFDELRVADKTAHDARTVLIMQAMSKASDEQKNGYQKALHDVAGQPAKLAELCGKIRQLGPPNYFPSYMIQHGLGVFTGGNVHPLVEPFDATAAWQQSLSGYLQCPAV